MKKLKVLLWINFIVIISIQLKAQDPIVENINLLGNYIEDQKLELNTIMNDKRDKQLRRFNILKGLSNSNTINYYQYSNLYDFYLRQSKTYKTTYFLNLLNGNLCHRSSAIKTYQKDIYKILLEDKKITKDELGLIGYYQIKSLKDSVLNFLPKKDSVYKTVNDLYSYPALLTMGQLGDTFAEIKVIQLFNETNDKYRQDEYAKSLAIGYLTALNTKKSRQILFTYIKLFPFYHKVIEGDDFKKETWSLSYHAAREIFKLYCEIPIEKKLYDRFMLEEKDANIIKDWLEKNNEEYRNIKDPVLEEENRLINNPKDEREKKIGEQIRKYRERKEKEAQDKLEKEKRDKK